MLGEHVERARLGFGCVKLGSASAGGSWRAQVRLVQHAIDRGITTFDTADAYGNGLSETIIGRAVRGRRSEVEIATKVGYHFSERRLSAHTFARLGRPVVQRVRGLRSHPTPGGGGTAAASGGAYTTQDLSPEYLRRAVDASLRRLGTDHIDVLQLHGPRTLVPSVADEMQRLKAAGKIRRFGVGAESLASAMEWLGVDGLDTVQVPFGVLDPQAATSVLPLAATRGVEVWARGVLGGGYLAMAVNRDPAIRADEKWPLIRDLLAVAARHDVPVYKLAVDYVRSFPGVATLLVGIQSEAHLSDNLAMMNSPMVADAAIAEVTGLLAGSVGEP